LQAGRKKPACQAIRKRKRSFKQTKYTIFTSAQNSNNDLLKAVCFFDIVCFENTDESLTVELMSSPPATDFRMKVLVVAVGYSPAVLTETVWALAHEKEPWIPDQVTVITTTSGADSIKEKLLDIGGWEDLKKWLGKNLSVDGKLAFGSSDSIRVIGDGQRDFKDIATPEESDAAADFILGVLRQYTEQQGTQVVASIAGGRKTMSALMLACMSLLGREQDRVCHVLAEDTFIAKNKEFLFPRNQREANAANIRLSDIPFIRVRGWYEQESGKQPASYSHMVSLFRKAAPAAVVEEKVVFDCAAKHLFVGEKEISLSSAEFDAAVTFLQDRLAGKYSSIQNLLPPEHKMLTDDDTFRKCLSRVRGKIEKDGFALLVDRLLPSATERSYRYKNIQFKPRRPQTSEK
jgi:CRISPR-associated protein (TIGR02584 family)